MKTFTELTLSEPLMRAIADLKYETPTAIQAETLPLLIGKQTDFIGLAATGTGKTFTIINLAYRLMKSGLAKRILFLVDRRALAAQAVTALASFEAEPGLKFDKIYEVYSQRFRLQTISVTTLAGP